MLVHAKDISKQQINPTGIEIAAVKKKNAILSTKVILTDNSVCEEFFSSVPHSTSIKQSKQCNIKGGARNTREMSPCKFFLSFYSLNLVS